MVDGGIERMVSEWARTYARRHSHTNTHSHTLSHTLTHSHNHTLTHTLSHNHLQIRLHGFNASLSQSLPLDRVLPTRVNPKCKKIKYGGSECVRE